jgi:hypothetical protein
MGVKHCKFTNPEIIDNMNHSEVDFDSEFWQEIRENECADESKKSKTYE